MCHPSIIKLFFTAAYLTALVYLLQACSPSDRVEPGPPTAEFTISAGLSGGDLMDFQITGIFWESWDGMAAAGYPVKLEATHKNLLSYEWYIHTDLTPTGTGDTYASSFSLNGVGATEWPVTIRARMVAAWEVNKDSIGRDTVDKFITLYDDAVSIYPTYVDTTSNRGHRYDAFPPYMGSFKGYLKSDPTEEITVVVDTIMGELGRGKPYQIQIGVQGLPSGCGAAMLFTQYTDRHFTTNGYFNYFSPKTLPRDLNENYLELCKLPTVHGQYKEAGQELTVRFAYDKTPRPNPYDDWDIIWKGRVIDEFVGTKIK